MDELDKEAVKQDMDDFMEAMHAINKILQAMYKRMAEIRENVDR